MGLSLFVFAVLPSVNVVKGVMLTNCVCLIPAVFGMYDFLECPNWQLVKCNDENRLVLIRFQYVFWYAGMLSRYPDRESRGKWLLKCCIDLVAIVFQVSALFLWPMFSSESNSRFWLLPISCVLISCGWWENYVDSSSPFGKI